MSLISFLSLLIFLSPLLYPYLHIICDYLTVPIHSTTYIFDATSLNSQIIKSYNINNLMSQMHEAEILEVKNNASFPSVYNLKNVYEL
jgi:hypothetical protein